MSRIRWLDLIILPIAVAILIAAWLEPWLVWVIRASGHEPGSPAPSAPVLLGVLLISGFVARTLLDRQVKQSRRWILLTGAAMLIGVAWITYGSRFPVAYAASLLDWRNSISPEAIVLVATALLWWRGIVLGRARAISDEGLERTFFNGLIALALLLFLNNFARYVPAEAMLASVLAFFATALTALTLVSLENARLRQTDATGPWLKVNRPWLVTILVVVAVVLCGALVITGLAAPDTLRDVLSALQPYLKALGDGLLTAIGGLFSIFFWLVSPLLPLLEWLARLLLTGLMGMLNIIHQLGVQINELRQEEVDSFLNSPTFATLSRGTAIVIGLIVIALLGLWALRRSGWLTRRNPDETHESIASRELLMKQLRDWLNRWRGKTVEAALPPYLPLNDDEARTQIRRVYQRFLEWASSIDRARAPHQTPAMFSDALGSNQPDQRDTLDTLTGVYERARYSIEPLTSAEARIAQDSLVTLQAASVIKSSSTER
jgi:hypothetical protein